MNKREGEGSIRRITRLMDKELNNLLSGSDSFIFFNAICEAKKILESVNEVKRK